MNSINRNYKFYLLKNDHFPFNFVNYDRFYGYFIWILSFYELEKVGRWHRSPFVPWVPCRENSTRNSSVRTDFHGIISSEYGTVSVFEILYVMSRHLSELLGILRTIFYPMWRHGTLFRIGMKKTFFFKMIPTSKWRNGTLEQIKSKYVSIKTHFVVGKWEFNNILWNIQ